MEGGQVNDRKSRKISIVVIEFPYLILKLIGNMEILEHEKIFNCNFYKYLATFGTF